jgi:hypothetical protein
VVESHTRVVPSNCRHERSRPRSTRPTDLRRMAGEVRNVAPGCTKTRYNSSTASPWSADPELRSPGAAPARSWVGEFTGRLRGNCRRGPTASAAVAFSRRSTPSGQARHRHQDHRRNTPPQIKQLRRLRRAARLPGWPTELGLVLLHPIGVSVGPGCRFLERRAG